MADVVTVSVPDLGDFKDVEVIDVAIRPGDVVALEAALVTLETEKATMEVPATVAGRVVKVLLAKGERASAGTPIALIEPGPAPAGAPATTVSAAGAVSEVPAPHASQAPAAPTATAPMPPAAPALIEVRVPDLGEFHDVLVIEVAARVGAQVLADAALVTLESEKATMEVPAPVAGTLASVSVEKGARVNTGTLLATLLPVADAAPQGPSAPGPVPAAQAAGAVPNAPASGEEPQRSVPASGLAPVEEVGFARAHAGPAVRRLARELGVDLGLVRGTGPKGRVTAEDVKGYVKRALSAPPAAAPPDGGARQAEVDFAKFGPVRREPLTRIQRIAGPRLHASWTSVPHVTQFDLADITDLETARGQLKQKAAMEGIKLTPLAFVLRAVCKALAEYPRFAASLTPDGAELVLKGYVHLGIATDTPAGLVVPVIRDANRRDVYELARELARLTDRARDGKLTPAEMSGGVFTVSSLGGIGGTAFTPIINAPEVAILGLSRSAQQPVWRDGKFTARLMLPLSLSYDHRVIDGAAAARFTTYLGAALADVRALLEAVP